MNVLHYSPIDGFVFSLIAFGCPLIVKQELAYCGCYGDVKLHHPVNEMTIMNAEV